MLALIVSDIDKNAIQGTAQHISPGSGDFTYAQRDKILKKLHDESIGTCCHGLDMLAFVVSDVDQDIIQCAAQHTMRKSGSI